MQSTGFFTGWKKTSPDKCFIFPLEKLCCHLTVSLQLIPRISQTCAGNLASRPKRGKNYVGRFLSKFPSDRESREELIESERFRNFFETVFFGGKGMNFFGCFANRDGATIYYFLSKRQKSHFVGQKKSLHWNGLINRWSKMSGPKQVWNIDFLVQIKLISLFLWLFLDKIRMNTSSVNCDTRVYQNITPPGSF